MNEDDQIRLVSVLGPKLASEMFFVKQFVTGESYSGISEPNDSKDAKDA